MVPSVNSTAYSHAERIVRIQNEFGLRIDECRPANARVHVAVAHLYIAFKNAPDDAFLPPNLAFLDLAVGVETSNLALVPVPQGERS